MAENGKSQSDDSQSGDGKTSAPSVPPGAAEVRTSDPIAGAPDPSGPPPERAASFQTAGSSGLPSLAPLTGTGGAEHSDDKNDPQQVANAKQHRAAQENHPNRKRRHRNTGADENRDDSEEERRQRGSHRHHGAAQAAKSKLKRVSGKMPHWSALLIMCVLSVICGAGGAWAYSAFSGSSQSDDEKKNSAKSDKSSQKGGDSKKSSGGMTGGSDSGQDAESSDLSKNLEDLGDGISQLTARLDRLTESMQESQLPIPEYYSGTSRIARMSSASDESPPLQPNAVPTQLNVLARKVEQMSDLPARIQSLEDAVNSLKEEIQKSSSSSTPEAGEP